MRTSGSLQNDSSGQIDLTAPRLLIDGQGFCRSVQQESIKVEKIVCVAWNPGDNSDVGWVTFLANT